MTALRVVLVDDELLARMRMRTLLQQAGVACELVAEFGDALSAQQAFQGWSQIGGMPDAVFLDIAMPGLDGMQLARNLSAMGVAPMVVFVTAHRDHALSAFEVDAVDYLTKPVRQERLDATLARVMQRRDAVKGLVPVPSSESVLVQDRGAMVRIPVHDIVYFKAEQKQVLIKTAHQQWTTDESLTELEQRLGDRFIRVHRNALVACQAMRQLALRADPETGQEGWAVRVEPASEWLAVSRRQIALVKEKMAGS